MTFRSFGLGAILVVVAAVLAALTLLPAVISALGGKINWVRLPKVRRGAPAVVKSEKTGGFWDTTTGLVMRHPVASVVATSALLIATASFVFTMNLGSNGLESLPEDSQSLHAFHVLTAEFDSGVMTADVAIDGTGIDPAVVQSSIDGLLARIAGDSFFGDTVVDVAPDGEVYRVRAGMLGDTTSQVAIDALGRLRGDYIPASFDGTGAEVYVTGNTAWNVDSIALMTQYMPYVFGFVLGTSFLLLLVVFRSIVVPFKAVVMNLISVGAAYGLLVLVFQEGFGADLLGFRQVPVIEMWLPLFLFSILFGLSMDYHVFMLSRIKERYDETGDNAGSVAFGLRSTASIITGAALIMVAVFGGFALGDMTMFQQMGFGLAAAVIIDVTLIRSILVPASMALLGDWNWYFPGWLKWLPELNVEGSRTAPAAPAQAAQISGASE
jgi:RND superfamily putative drug exporter